MARDTPPATHSSPSVFKTENSNIQYEWISLNRVPLMNQVLNSFFLLRFDLEENLNGENVGETTPPKSSRIYRNRPADESFPFSTIDFK